MKLLAWNLNHRAARRRIAPWIPEAIRANNPDMIILTEYVEGDDHAAFLAELTSMGLTSHSLSNRIGYSNQVLIASRKPLASGSIVAPDLPWLRSGLVHVKIPCAGIQLLGFRMPYYKGKESHLIRKAWEWLLDAVVKLRDDAALIAGDFNLAPGGTVSGIGNVFERLSVSGWRHAVPASGGSFRGGRAIDHAFHTSSLIMSDVLYSWDFQSRSADAVSRRPSAGIPDHAMRLGSIARVGHGAEGRDLDTG